MRLAKTQHMHIYTVHPVYPVYPGVVSCSDIMRLHTEITTHWARNTGNEMQLEVPDYSHVNSVIDNAVAFLPNQS